jgi:biopolymer transport protein ExbD
MSRSIAWLSRVTPVLVLSLGLLACVAPSAPAASDVAAPAAVASTDRASSPATALPTATPVPPVASANAIPYDLPHGEDFAPPPLLPDPASSSTQQMTVVFAVDLDAHGQLSVDGHAIAGDADLLRLAKAAHAKDPTVRAVIRADKNTTYGNVIQVMDTLKRASIDKIAFAVQAIRPP